MAQFSRKAVDLLKEVMSHGPTSLPPFNEELIRQILDECEQHSSSSTQLMLEVKEAEAQRQGVELSDVQPAWDQHAAESVSLIIHHEAIKRCKRVVMTYMLERMKRLQANRRLRRALPRELKDRMCPAEVEYYRDFDQHLSEFMGPNPETGINLDLTLDLTPPKDPDVAVRVLRDYGQISTPYGSLNLERGLMTFMPRAIAEPLLRDGVVVEVEQECIL